MAEDEGNPADAAGKPTDPLAPEQPVQLGTAEAEADLWARIRAGFAMPALDSDLVREHEQWYARRPDYVQRMTERGSRYLYHIVEEVQKRGMPSELALLPFIESAFNPQAMSSAKASGMWQFIPSTGRDYALRQNIFRDDRRDVLASTRAALDYLNRLHDKFDDWQLALAAYNCGEGNVAKAIARNQRAGLPTDYASLNLPIETRHYVPKLLAVKNIVAEPDRYGLSLPGLRNHPHFLSVPIQRDIDVDLAARLAGLSSDDFKTLNPQLNKPVILAAGTPQILLPYDNVDGFVRNLGGHRGPLASWTAWVVPHTMRPADAAQKLGMNESVLREVNRIPPRMLIKTGSALLVPRNAQRSEDVSEHLADNASMLLAPDAPPLKRLTVKARKGDTVASIAQRYRVSAANVAQWNHLGAQQKLATGASLAVYVASAKTVARPSAVAKNKTARDTRVAAARPAGKSTAKITVQAKSPATHRGRRVAAAGAGRNGN
jgi:membrane-bound lytic murein transglycosylase D